MKMIKHLVPMLFVAAVATGCSSPKSGLAAQSGSSTATPATTEDSAVYHMQLHKVMDEEGAHKLAFTYLIPDGWSATDTIKWIPNDFMTPEVGTTIIKSPDGLTELVSMSGAWTMFGHSPTGDYGSLPPKSVSDILLSGFKQQHPSVQFAVLTKEDTPVDSLLGQAPPQGSNSGLKAEIKVRFSQGGKSFLMKSQGRLDSMQMTPVPSGMGGTIYEGGWMITQTMAVTAPEEQMDGAMKLLGIVLTSSHMDPHFFNTLVQTRKIISDNFYARQREIGEISRIISQTNDEISDTIMSAYHTGQAAQDREISGFDDYIKGVDKYQDSDGQVDLPSGYAHAFADDNGHYIVTDQHGFDPNVGSTGSTWRELQKGG